MGSLFSSFFYFLDPFHSRTILILDSLVCIFLFDSDSASYVFCSAPVFPIYPNEAVLFLFFSFLSHFFPSLLAFYFK